MQKGKHEGKSVDERLAEFEKELNRIDRLLEDQKETVKSNMKEFESDFGRFMDDMGFDYQGIKENLTDEMDRLGAELEFTGKAIKRSFEHLKRQFKDRKED